MSEDRNIILPHYLEGKPECSQKREKCKFNEMARCTILTDTIFKRECPFYKERDDGQRVDL